MLLILKKRMKIKHLFGCTRFRSVYRVIDSREKIYICSAARRVKRPPKSLYFLLQEFLLLFSPPPKNEGFERRLFSHRVSDFQSLSLREKDVAGQRGQSLFCCQVHSGANGECSQWSGS